MERGGAQPLASRPGFRCSPGTFLRAGARDLARRRDLPLQVTGVSHLFGLHWTPVPVTATIIEPIWLLAAGVRLRGVPRLLG